MLLVRRAHGPREIVEIMTILNSIKELTRVVLCRKLTFTFDRIDFTCTNLSWKKLWNWFVGEVSFLLKTKKAWAYPTHVQVEPASGCNLRCPLCYITVHGVKNSMMHLDDFKRLIDEIGDYMFLLHLWGWGEPFLNKDIYEMIAYAKKKDIKVITSTNGHILDVDKLLDSGLDAIIIALDGVNQQTYEKLRNGGDYRKVIEKLESLLKRKRDKDVASPVINLRMVVTKENEHEIPEMKALARGLEVDLLTLKTLGSHDNERLWRASLPEDHDYRRYDYDSNDSPIKIKNSCKRLWNHPYIFDDGTAGNCCYALKGEEIANPLGNVFESGGFSAVWFGEGYGKTRAEFLAYRRGDSQRGPKRCKTCNWNYVDSKRYVSHAFWREDLGLKE